MKNLVRGWGLVALGWACSAHAMTPGRDFGPEQFVQAVTVLEQQPLDKDIVASRPLLLSWLQDTPKVTITWNLCQAKMPWAMGAKTADPASVLLFTQDLLENASAQITSPKASTLEQETQALEGTLRMYERMRTHADMTNLQAEAIRKAYQAEGAKGLKAYTCAGTGRPVSPGTKPTEPLISTAWERP